MKLCRFLLKNAPEEARSGIYHEGRYYETDGEKAVGIRDPGAINLLPPIGTPPAARVFETYTDSSGETNLTYRYINPTDLYGPNAEIELPQFSTELDFNVHVVGTVRDRGEMIESQEASDFVLGYALMLVFFEPELAEHERHFGLPYGPSHDVGVALGPYLTTPDELTEFCSRSDPTHYSFRYEIKVGDVQIAKNLYEPAQSFSDLLQFGSRIRTIQVGEIVAWPMLDKPSLDLSALGRSLTTGDKIEVSVDGFGTLVARIS